VIGKIVNTMRDIFTRHKLLVSASFSLLVAIAIFIALFFVIPREVELSSNPTVAEYQRELVNLKAKADKDSSDLDAHKNYAVALYASGDLQAAKSQYEKVIQLNSSDASAYNYLANTHRDLGETEAAVRSYKKAISLDPRQVNYYANLANMQLYTLNKPADAIATYKSGLVATPANSQLEFLLATAYEQTGDVQAARQTYQNILSYEADNQLAKSALARLGS